MTRVFIHSKGRVTLVVPEAWTRWTFKLHVFQRRDNQIEQWADGAWVRLHSEPVIQEAAA